MGLLPVISVLATMVAMYTVNYSITFNTFQLKSEGQKDLIGS
jgi:hypothetical protein